MSAPAERTAGGRSGSIRSRTVILSGAALLAATDLASKWVAEKTLTVGESMGNGPVDIRLFYNTGVAFSLGADLPPWTVATATGLIIVVLAGFLLASAPTMTGLARVGAALLLGGALGNFVDRLDGRGVVDFLHSGWFPTFNLADVFVTVGAALLVLGAFRGPGEEDPG
ncbi:signal peptidase II [Paeniglutamicibacter gangotriensis]|uniref:Lipoprotein signal peptidase n=1 Tax=Paeniglutamicibacter gangotriensis TaxID=254787 RepID=A0A5B0E6S1_9MICC|nr:signal peptidase II [Paeniglutamicibacter gangotriensis]KAA0973079.1 signal peptidase II [Paeniglutamicibacter gangotriensis]